MTALAIFILIALVASFAFFLGAGPALLVIAVVVLLAAGVWFAVTTLSGRRPAEEVRRTRPQELLGPGGPDDPERV